jgi:hypothetical protein
LESQTTPCNWFYRVGVVVWGEPFPLQSEPDPNDECVFGLTGKSIHPLGIFKHNHVLTIHTFCYVFKIVTCITKYLEETTIPNKMTSIAPGCIRTW